MTIPNPIKLRVVPTPKQREAIRAIKRRVRYILTGGAISTAKSYGLAQIFISMAMRFPRTRYGIFRRHLTVLKRTTYQTFRKVAYEYGLVEGKHYKVNRSEMYWEFLNGAQIYFMEIDETKDPDFNKIKGLELTAAGIDEVNETVEEGFNIIGSRVGRENHHGEPAFVLGTCNPANNWVKARWYDPWLKNELSDDHAFIPSLPKDNPHNSQEYLDALNRMPLQFRKRYVEGDWEYVDDANALFSNRVIDRVIKPIKQAGTRYIGADIAREGNDNNVFALIENGMIVDLFTPELDTSDDAAILIQVGDALIKYMNDNRVGYKYVTIDAVGLGAGVLDYLRSKGYYINSFKSGSATTELHKDGTPMYDMLRSERYWKVSKAMERGDLSIWKGLPNLEDLRRDLLAHNVEITDKQIKVESKEKMRKRLQRSPDFSDAVIMAYSTSKPVGVKDIVSAGSYDDWFDDDE